MSHSDWFARAACRDEDMDLFFADGVAGHFEPALAVCAGCPVQKPCVAYAMRHNLEFGVWGATTPTQRKRMLREQGRAKNTNLAPRAARNIGNARHGTRWGYIKGCMCEDCTNAERDYRRERSKREMA